MGMIQRTIHNHLEKMAALPNFLNGDLRVTFKLSLGFTVESVAEKHGWRLSMQALFLQCRRKTSWALSAGM